MVAGDEWRGQSRKANSSGIRWGEFNKHIANHSIDGIDEYMWCGFFGILPPSN